MDATFTSNNDEALRPDQRSSGVLWGKWLALHEAAAAVAAIAGAPGTSPSAQVRNFPALVQGADGWRHRLAEQGIDDLVALMELGVAALLSALEREINPRAAARALWREFEAARDAVLGLAPEDEDDHVEAR